MSSHLFKDRRVLWMPFDAPTDTAPAGTPCCAAMHAALTFSCQQHDDPFACADQLVIYNAVFDEYGLIVHDGGASYVLMQHCPWCGTALPESQRDRWFDEVEALGVDDDDLPPDYLSGAWRVKP